MEQNSKMDRQMEVHKDLDMTVQEAENQTEKRSEWMRVTHPRRKTRRLTYLS